MSPFLRLPSRVFSASCLPAPPPRASRANFGRELEARRLTGAYSLGPHEGNASQTACIWRDGTRAPSGSGVDESPHPSHGPEPARLGGIQLAELGHFANTLFRHPTPPSAPPARMTVSVGRLHSIHPTCDLPGSLPAAGTAGAPPDQLLIGHWVLTH